MKVDKKHYVKPDSTETNGVGKSRSPTVNGVSPVVNGVSPAVNGVSPAVNGVSPAVNGVSPAVNGVSPAVNGAIASGFNGNVKKSLLKESEEQLLENGSPCLPSQTEFFSFSSEDCGNLEMLCNMKLDAATMYDVFKTTFNKERPAHVIDEASGSANTERSLRTEMRLCLNGYAAAVAANGALPAKSQEAQDTRDFTTHTESTLAQGAKPTSLVVFEAALLRGIKEFVPRAAASSTLKGAEAAVQGAEAAVPGAEAAKSPTVLEAEAAAPQDDGQNTAFEDPREEGEDIVASSSDSNTEAPEVYEFEMRQSDCGRFFGRNGYFIKSLIEQTQIDCVAYNHPLEASLKMISLRGTNSQITAALGHIRKRFPIDRYPELTLQRSISANPVQCMLPLPSGASIIVCSVIDPVHFFVQQVSHHSIHSLPDMTQQMSNYYNSLETPRVQTLQTGIVCVAPVQANNNQIGWYRTIIVAVDEAVLMCTVKYLDYGGYANIHCSTIRQINGDFLRLPFLATECILGGVAPVGDDWSPESKMVFESLTRNKVLTCDVWDSTPEGIPVINLYDPCSFAYINTGLINAKVARPIVPFEPVALFEESAFQSQEPAAVLEDPHGPSVAAEEERCAESSAAEEERCAESSAAEEERCAESSAAEEERCAESSAAEEERCVESSAAEEERGAESSAAGQALRS